MYRKIKEAADIAGISVRTLHHYDKIGLLKPAETSTSGYRLYTEENLETLQQILFFKELGFSLPRIKEIIYEPSFNRLEALEMHQKLLRDKRGRLDEMITTIGRTIQQAKGELDMTSEEKFKGFNFNNNQYEQEARERWGNSAVEESNAKLKEMATGKKQKLALQWEYLYKKLSELRHLPPDSEKAQRAIEEWYFLLQEFGSYSVDAFKGLGEMYIADERFTRNIDQYGEGLSLFMRDAMAVYAARNR